MSYTIDNHLLDYVIETTTDPLDYVPKSDIHSRALVIYKSLPEIFSPIHERYLSDYYKAGIYAKNSLKLVTNYNLPVDVRSYTNVCTMTSALYVSSESKPFCIRAIWDHSSVVNYLGPDIEFTTDPLITLFHSSTIRSKSHWELSQLIDAITIVGKSIRTTKTVFKVSKGKLIMLVSYDDPILIKIVHASDYLTQFPIFSFEIATVPDFFDASNLRTIARTKLRFTRSSKSSKVSRDILVSKRFSSSNPLFDPSPRSTEVPKPHEEVEIVENLSEVLEGPFKPFPKPKKT